MLPLFWVEFCITGVENFIAVMHICVIVIFQWISYIRALSYNFCTWDNRHTNDATEHSKKEYGWRILLVFDLNDVLNIIEELQSLYFL